MLKIDSSKFLQNIDMLTRQLFLLFEKSTTFWDNPRMSCLFLSGGLRQVLLYKSLQNKYIVLSQTVKI